MVDPGSRLRQHILNLRSLFYKSKIVSHHFLYWSYIVTLRGHQGNIRHDGLGVLSVGRQRSDGSK